MNAIYMPFPYVILFLRKRDNQDYTVEWGFGISVLSDRCVLYVLILNTEESE